MVEGRKRAEHGALSWVVVRDQCGCTHTLVGTSGADSCLSSSKARSALRRKGHAAKQMSTTAFASMTVTSNPRSVCIAIRTQHMHQHFRCGFENLPVLLSAMSGSLESGVLGLPAILTSMTVSISDCTFRSWLYSGRNFTGTSHLHLPTTLSESRRHSRSVWKETGP